ncbi:MAG: hypothetical protein WAO00_14995 [Chthoniobacterales bacterium]
MRKDSGIKQRERSEDEILDQGIKQLLRTTKEQAKKRGKPLTRDQLRKEGYSERFIDQVERA